MGTALAVPVLVIPVVRPALVLTIDKPLGERRAQHPVTELADRFGHVGVVHPLSSTLGDRLGPLLRVQPAAVRSVCHV